MAEAPAANLARGGSRGPRGAESDHGLFYVCHEHPVLTQTFTAGEIAGLAAEGLAIRAVSCRRPASGSACSGVLYLRGPLEPAVLGALARAARRRPGAVRRLLATLLRARYRDEAGRCLLRGLLQLAWGAALAEAAGPRAHFHAQFLDAASTAAFVAAALGGGSFSFTNHTAYNPYLPREKLSAARFAVSISEFDRRLLLRQAGGAGADRLRVIYQGIDTASFRIPRDPPEPDGAARILSVGALREKKGHDVLLRALARLAGEGLPFRAVVVGGGPWLRPLARLASELGIAGRVDFAGPEEPGRVRARLAAADLFVLACRRAQNGDLDGIPVSLMEAMAAGVPVVSTRLSGIPELIAEGDEGRLAAPGDDGSLAGEIREALRDRAASARMALRAREKVARRHERKVSVARLAAALREAVR